jgi:hypothetical protein
MKLRNRSLETLDYASFIEVTATLKSIDVFFGSNAPMLLVYINRSIVGSQA